MTNRPAPLNHRDRGSYYDRIVPAAAMREPPRLEGRRVLLVEDVISTGGTVSAELALMKKLDAHVVGVVTAIRETRVWIDKLGPLVLS